MILAFTNGSNLCVVSFAYILSRVLVISDKIIRTVRTIQKLFRKTEKRG